jgi:hypothetical protein
LIQTEEINRQGADNLITNSLAEETTERKAKDELLQSDISTHDEQISTLQTDVASVENKLFNTTINKNDIGNERYLTTNEKMITLIGTSETGENSLRLG